MDNLINNIKDNSILIIPNNIKETILKQIRTSNKKLNIKLFNLEEFIKKLTFDYDERTIYELMKYKNINYSISKLYINNIKYVENDSNEYKIHNLYDIKTYLNNYLIKDTLFKKLISNKEIIIYGYDYITEYQKHILNTVNNYKLINKNYKKYNHVVYEFDSLEYEVRFIAERISELIKNNVDINKIFISNLDTNYYTVIKRVFKMYNIPINIKEKNNIYETNIGKYFINNLSNNIDDLLNKIKEKYDMNDKKNKEIYTKIIDTLNKFYFTNDYISVKDNIINVMKKTYLSNTTYKNAVNEINIENNIIPDDSLVFLVGFNLNKIPITIKDEDYINDDIKPSFLEKSYYMNIINKELYIKIIKNIHNLTITYKLHNLNESFYPSLLIDEYNLEVIKENLNYSNYSSKLNKILLTEYIDNLIKYNEKNKYLDLLYSNYNINYKKYDNKYNIISKEIFYKYLNNTLNLSYSSMDNFYHCKFKFYLSNILKIDDYEDKLSTYIGNIYHYVLSKSFKENFNFNETVNYYITNNPYPKSYKNDYFINETLKELVNVIEVIKYQNTLGSMNETLYEKKIDVEKPGDINITFKGFIDKILKKDNNIVIIDYKTYKVDVNLNYLPYGLKMQLPVYLYLTKNLNKDYEIIGFYLQQILFGKFNKEYGKTLKEIKKNNLKLKGYSIGNEDKINLLDTTYADSELIYGMKLTSNGFSKYSNTLTKQEIDKLINITDSKINECIRDIKNRDFKINPKMINKQNIGCTYCKFKDICFMTNNDIEELENITDLSYLKE